MACTSGMDIAVRVTIVAPDFPMDFRRSAGINKRRESFDAEILL
jgi:hypothetical protein